MSYTLRLPISLKKKKQIVKLLKLQKTFSVWTRRFVISLIMWFRRNQKALFLWIFLFFTIAIFQRFIARKIAKYPLISQAEVGTLYFDNIYNILTVGLILFFLWLWIKNYRIARSVNFWIFLLGGSYLLLFRNNNEDNLQFISFLELQDPKIFYTDIFTLLSLLCLSLYLRNFSKSRKLYDLITFKVERWMKIYSGGESMDENNYFEDLPFDGSTPTHNEVIINTLISRIHNLKPSRAFIIGINGNWGQGKTSFLNRFEYKIKYEEKSDRPIFFWFNPWQHQDEKTIIHNFFNNLKKELSVFSGDSNSSIDSYVNKVLETVSSSYSSILKKPSMILHEEENISNYYQKVEYLINDLNKKIIVFVDDLDRLNKNEILEVLRILRNVANFKNLIFICGLDKNYLIKELKITPSYLNKIFNVEINLPDQTQTNIIIELKRLINLSNTLKNNEKVKITQSLDEILDISSEDDSFLVRKLLKEKVEENFEDQLIPLSSTMFLDNERETKRFFNFLTTNLGVLGNIDDVDLNNFLTFNLLIFKYQWMLKYFGSRFINLWLGDGNVLIFDPSKPLVKGFLAEKIEELENFDKLILFNLLKKLFPKEGASEEGSIKINQRRYFPVYLNNNLFNEVFSYSELLNNHKNLKLKSFLDNKIKKKRNSNALFSDIKKFALKSENLQSEGEFFQLVDLINENYFPTVTNIETAYFFEKAEACLENKVLDFYNKVFINAENHFGEFLRELNLYYTTKPSGFHSHQNDFFTYFQSVKEENVKYLKPPLVKSKLLNLLRNYIEENASHDKISRIFLDCTEIYYQLYELRFFSNEAKDIFKEYLINNFKDVFLKEEPRKIIDFFRPSTVLSLFGKNETIESFISQIDDLIKQENFSRNALKEQTFYKSGMDQFIDFVQYFDMTNSSEEEKKKQIYLVDYLMAFKNKGFIHPEKKDVVINQTFRKLNKSQKDFE